MKLHQIRASLLFLVFITAPLLELLAQTPTHYPTGNEPVRWSAVNILVYIVIPVVLVAVWIILRRRKTGKKAEKDDA